MLLGICWVLIVCSCFFLVSRSLSVARCVLRVVWCLLFVCYVFVVCGLWFVVWCLLIGICCVVT